MERLNRIYDWFFWQEELARDQAFLWTVIIVVLSAYGMGLAWYLGYGLMVYIIVPFALQTLFAWHHSLLKAAGTRKAARNDDSGLLLPNFGEEDEGDVYESHEAAYDMSNIIVLPRGYLPAVQWKN